MRKFLSDAGLAMLKAFWASLLVLAPGIWLAPNLDRAIALGIAALCAASASGLAALQVVFPAFSVRNYVPDPWGPMIDSFLHAAVPAFITAITGWLAMPDLSLWRSVVTAAMSGAFAAGFRAIQGWGTVGERPAPQTGIDSLQEELPVSGPVATGRRMGAARQRRVLLPA